MAALNITVRKVRQLSKQKDRNLEPALIFENKKPKLRNLLQFEKIANNKWNITRHVFRMKIQTRKRGLRYAHN